MKCDNTVKDFYDDFAVKLLSDYCNGNARVESALNFACAHLIRNQRKLVLDLGFGLGWSSYEFARSLPGAKVTGLDLSPRLVELATAMFGGADNLDYACQDLTDQNWSDRRRNHYDACVMLDVYEHIPAIHRASFHQSLSSVLSDDAMLVLSCPTPLHQEFLRKNEPDGLQPVDEDVTFDDLVRLAQEIGGTLIHLEHKSIWASNDYFHAIISRRISRSSASSDGVVKLTARQERLGFVKKAIPVVGNQIVDNVKATTPPFHRRILGRLR